MGYNTEVITNIADTDLQIAHANGYYYIVCMYREDGYHEVLGDLDAGMMKQLAGFCGWEPVPFAPSRSMEVRARALDDVEDL
jgi:hypothetical protein